MSINFNIASHRCVEVGEATDRRGNLVEEGPVILRDLVGKDAEVPDDLDGPLDVDAEVGARGR